jgi:hypothetical protein
MHRYTHLETCAQQYLTSGAVDSASPDKSGSIVAVLAASDNSGVDDIDGVPADEDLGGAAPVRRPRIAGSRRTFHCCSEKFIHLLLRFKLCDPPRFIHA